MATGNSKMIAVTGSGWSRGLENVLRGELRNWFATRRWWTQAIIWAASINLIYLMVAISMPADQKTLDSTFMIFNIFMGLAGAIGVSIVMQSAVVGEKRSGTAAWVLSKPVSRMAFILAKLIANTIGIAVVMVLIQGFIAYLITALAVGVTLPVPAFIAGLGVHMVNILFYLCLTLLLGVVFEHSAPVIGIPLAVLFSQNFIMQINPVLVSYLPWSLAVPVSDTAPSVAMSVMTGVPVVSFMPLYTALAAEVVFVALALWIFQKQEL
jgi:ABC-2 type transport system permease protein